MAPPMRPHSRHFKGGGGVKALYPTPLQNASRTQHSCALDRTAAAAAAVGAPAPVNSVRPCGAGVVADEARQDHEPFSGRSTKEPVSSQSPSSSKAARQDRELLPLRSTMESASPWGHSGSNEALPEKAPRRPRDKGCKPLSRHSTKEPVSPQSRSGSKETPQDRKPLSHRSSKEPASPQSRSGRKEFARERALRSFPDEDYELLLSDSSTTVEEVAPQGARRSFPDEDYELLLSDSPTTVEEVVPQGAGRSSPDEDYELLSDHSDAEEVAGLESGSGSTKIGPRATMGRFRVCRAGL